MGKQFSHSNNLYRDGFCEYFWNYHDNIMYHSSNI